MNLSALYAMPCWKADWNKMAVTTLVCFMDSQDGTIESVANCSTCHAFFSAFGLRSEAKRSYALYSIVSAWPPSERAQHVFGDAHSTCAFLINKQQKPHI